MDKQTYTRTYRQTDRYNIILTHHCPGSWHGISYYSQWTLRRTKTADSEPVIVGALNVPNNNSTSTNLPNKTIIIETYCNISSKHTRTKTNLKYCYNLLVKLYEQFFLSHETNTCIRNWRFKCNIINWQLFLWQQLIYVQIVL